MLQANSLKIHIFLAHWMLGLCVLVALSPQRAAAAETPIQPAPQAAAVPPDYRIGPGDTIKVYVFQNDELSVTVPVRPDGKISTPLVEDMVAVGKTSVAVGARHREVAWRIRQVAQGQCRGDDGRRAFTAR